MIIESAIQMAAEPYRSGKSTSWPKTVCTMVEHFTVIDAAPSGLWVVT